MITHYLTFFNYYYKKILIKKVSFFYLELIVKFRIFVISISYN